MPIDVQIVLYRSYHVLTGGWAVRLGCLCETETIQCYILQDSRPLKRRHHEI